VSTSPRPLLLALSTLALLSATALSPVGHRAQAAGTNGADGTSIGLNDTPSIASTTTGLDGTATLAGQAGIAAGDSFDVNIGATNVTITIHAGDTLTDIANKISAVAGVTASATTTGTNDVLTIRTETVNDAFRLHNNNNVPLTAIGLGTLVAGGRGIDPVTTPGGNGGDGGESRLLNHPLVPVYFSGNETGGDGGDGGTTAYNLTPTAGGNGGNGGHAVHLRNNSFARLFVESGATLQGGDGGAGGAGSGGGANGANGAGGTGIRQDAIGTGGAWIVVEGTVAGGLSGDGTTRAEAIHLVNSGNRLTLTSTSSLIGDVTLGTSDNTLELSGTGSEDANFRGVQFLEASPGATWTLSGNIDPLGSAVTVGTNTNSTINVTGVLDTTTLVKNGEGTLYLGSAHSFTGGITVTGGVLAGTGASLDGDIANSASVIFRQTTDGTYSGNLSGTGTMTKEGAGTLELTGANTYGGTTTVSGGILRAGTASAFAQNSAYSLIGGTLDLNDHDLTAASLTGSGNVDLGSATLTLDTPGTGTFAGVISGGGALTKTGTGTAILTETNTYAGGTTVGAGGLLVNGAIGDVTVAGGAVLGGSGTVGNIMASGTVATGNSIGTLNVAGDASFLAGSTYQVEINAAGQSDLLAVSGAVTIAANGTTLDILGAPGSYPFLQSYTALTAAGGINGAFETLRDDLPDLDLRASYTGNELVLSYNRADRDFSAKEIFPSGTAAGLNAALGFSAALRQRGMAGALGGSGQGAGALGDLALGYVPRRQAASPASRVIRPDHEATWAMWGMATGSLTRVGSSGTSAGWNTKLAGFTAGFERAVETDNLSGTLGFAGGFSGGNLESGTARGDMAGWFAGLYGGLSAGALSLSASATGAWQTYDYSRATGAAIATSSTDGYSLAGSAEAFYDMMAGTAHQSSLRFGPFASLDAAHTSQDGFMETGAGVLNLTVQGTEASQAVSGLGLRLGLNRPVGTATFSLEGNLGWQHLFGDTRVASVSSIAFAGVDFGAASAEQERDRLSLGLGAAMRLDTGLTTRIRYQGHVSGSGSEHSASAGLTYRF
jgi:autotransporter-associated beta strand protein